MRIHGTPDQIIAEVARTNPEIYKALAKIKGRVPTQRRAVYEYQACVLYALARPYDRPECNLLEIGTAYGFSGSFICAAARKAKVVTLNPKEWEIPVARQSLSYYGNATVVEKLSWDYLADYAGPELDFIFVDGDHKRVLRDMPWWNHLKVGGLMMFHDYAPEGTPRPCPPVWFAVNAWTAQLGRGLDVEVIDDTGVGLAGLVRREGETWNG